MLPLDLLRTLRRIERKYRKLGFSPRKSREMAWRVVIQALQELLDREDFDDDDEGSGLMVTA